MADFPDFGDIRPDSAEFTCIHPCKGKERARCTKAVNKNDRRVAVELRAKISSSFADGELHVADLREYAGLCCCVQVHRKRGTKLGTLDQVAQRWTYELAGQSDVSVITGTAAPALLQRFLAYAPKEPRDNLSHVLSSTLSEDEFRTGTIYMVRRHEDPGFVKIGITYRTADYRFSFFTSSCGFEPIPLRQIRHVPCVRRVERLVHSELKSYRRECTTCVNRADCKTLHTEWFQVEEELALAVMEGWAKWAICTEPYSVDGRLGAMWMELELETTRCGQLTTSDKITNVLQAQQARENALVTLFANMTLGRKPPARQDIAQAEILAIAPS